MFLGTAPADVTKMLHEHAEKWNVKDIYVGCSGNHRVRAAIEAKLPSIKVQVTDQQLSKAKRLAIQLSHNAITGEDDPFTLKQLYDSIEDVDMRRYSGLDDVTLGLLENISMDPIGEAQLDFVPITFLFLPHELEDMKEQMDKAQKVIKGDELWLASLSQYDRMVQALHAASKAYGVKNMATALEIVLRTFEAHLTDLQSGAFDVNMELKHKNPLPIEVVLGVNLIPSGTARTISMAIKKAQKAEPDLKPLDIIERWAKDANAL